MNSLFRRFFIIIVSIFLLVGLQIHSFASNTCNITLLDTSLKTAVFTIPADPNSIVTSTWILTNMDPNSVSYTLFFDGNSTDPLVKYNNPNDIDENIPGKKIRLHQHDSPPYTYYIYIGHSPKISQTEPNWELRIAPIEAGITAQHRIYSLYKAAASRLDTKFTGYPVFNLVGDKDDFDPNHPEDTPPQSQIVTDLIASRAPEDNDVNLDKGGVNRPVGLTHYFNIPENALISSASIEFGFKGSECLYNDGILYKTAFFPVILLKDLLGFEPYNYTEYIVNLDLSRVPVRTGGDPGPGGHFSDVIDEHRNLVPELYDGQFDMVFVDDVTVDYSELRVFIVFPSEMPGDLDGDRDIDIDDYQLFRSILGKSEGDDGYTDKADYDNDNNITYADYRIWYGYYLNQ